MAARAVAAASRPLPPVHSLHTSPSMPLSCKGFQPLGALAPRGTCSSRSSAFIM